jgi:cell division initiation protein
MKKFSKTLRGYNPKEVNAFLDEIIGQVEKMVAENKAKNSMISDLKKQINEIEEQINRYKAMEVTMNKTIVAAQDSGEQIRRIARQESDLIVNEARKNANRIVNDSLLRAEKIEYTAANLRKNISLLKKRLKSILESQLELVEDIETLDFESNG